MKLKSTIIVLHTSAKLQILDGKWQLRLVFVPSIQPLNNSTKLITAESPNVVQPWPKARKKTWNVDPTSIVPVLMITTIPWKWTIRSKFRPLKSILSKILVFLETNLCLWSRAKMTIVLDSSSPRVRHWKLSLKPDSFIALRLLVLMENPASENVVMMTKWA